MKTVTLARPLALMWADFDPHAPKGSKWATYSTKADQRANRPDLKPVRVALVRAVLPARPRRSKPSPDFLTRRMEVVK